VIVATMALQFATTSPMSTTDRASPAAQGMSLTTADERLVPFATPATSVAFAAI